MATKGELLQKLVAKDVLKNKMITVACQMFIGYEKEMDNTNQIFKEYENYYSDDKIKNDILDKVCGDGVKEVCSERDEVYKSISIIRFIKILNNKEKEMLSNKQLLLKKVSIFFY